MTQFEKFKSMCIDEMVDWLDEYGQFDISPWMSWWDRHYCNNCKPVTAFVPDYGREMKFAWCELNGKCKFFSDMNDVPSNQDIIRMWLESKTDKTVDDELDELFAANDQRVAEMIEFEKIMEE